MDPHSGPGNRGAASASPYRRLAEVAPERPGASPARVEAGTVAVIAFALACSLLRFGLFAVRPERWGIDPLLALTAAAACAHYLVRLLRG